MDTLQSQEDKNRAEKIEKNKNKFDLKPNIDFVSQHKEVYEEGLANILEREPSVEAQEWVNGLEFVGEQDIVDPQVHPEDVRRVLSSMPEVLIKLSKLKTISYHTFGNPRVVPVPGFDNDGNLDQRKITLAPVDEFPAPGEHPSRILVGVSTGDVIYPTPIPESVSKDKTAVYLYQAHVLMHEFFHTVDYPRRNPETRSEILLEIDGERFTFQDWWKEFEDLILSGKEPGPVSNYASTYESSLNREFAEQDYKKFSSALAEQICESFVAYQLNIISNRDDWTDFRVESFGNKEQEKKFQQGKVKSANLKWELIDRLCRSRLLKSE